MESRLVNTNGESDSTEENPATTTAYQLRCVSQSQSPQLQPETRHRVVDEQLFRFPSGTVDLQTLESSFGGLSVLDPTVRQQNPPLWSNRSSSSRINGGGGEYWSRPSPYPHREIDSTVNQFPMFPNDYVNGGSYVNSNAMVNNGFSNGNSRDVPYFSRNRFLDQIRRRPWDSNNGFGSIVLLAKERDSSNELQKKISVASKETIDVIFNDVVFRICELMVDPFGHHVFQKLMEKCSFEQITQVLGLVTQNQPRFVTICIDPIGTRAIQSLMKCLHTEEQILSIVGAVTMAALTLTRSNNAKHVILQCFNQFSPLQNRNLREVIARNCLPIAIDQHGCCMLQQCLDSNCNVLKQRLIHEIIDNALKLCVNCYGNYVVQFVVELEDRNVTIELVKQLERNYAYLSRNKYGSHAVQKLLNIQYIDTTRFIVYDLLRDRDFDTLLTDPFGNYVIQTAWVVCKDYNLRSILVEHIRLNKPLMRCNRFGNKILEKLNL